MKRTLKHEDPWYTVTWAMDVQAKSRDDAALKADAARRRRDSIATVYDVVEHLARPNTSTAHDVSLIRANDRKAMKKCWRKDT